MQTKLNHIKQTIKKTQKIITTIVILLEISILLFSIRIGFSLYNLSTPKEDPILPPIQIKRTRLETLRNWKIKEDSLMYLSEEKLKSHLKIAMILFREVTKETWTEEDIALITAYELLADSPVSENDVQEFIRLYFGIENSNLKEGTYISPLSGEFKIQKENEFYKTNLNHAGIADKVNQYHSYEVKENQIIVHYDYRQVASSIEESKQLGISDVTLELQNEHLILKEIQYRKKDEHENR